MNIPPDSYVPINLQNGFGLEHNGTLIFTEPNNYNTNGLSTPDNGS